MAAKPSPKRNKQPFDKSDSIERQYERDLRKVAREVGRIIEGHQKTIGHMGAMNKALEDYSVLLTPWAELKAFELARASDMQDRRAWEAATKDMSDGIKRELRSAQIGGAVKDIMARQVRLIKSLPIEAGQRVHKLVLEGMSDSTRAAEIAEEIARSGEVTESRAMLIARTETTRAATALTQARSDAIGATHYTWRTVHDARVRTLHRELDGTVHSWKNPPVAGEKGERAHPGAIYNCRCRPVPIIPDR